MRSVQARAAREGGCRRGGKMMPTYHMYPHSTAPSFSTFCPCFRVNFYSVALKLSCNMCVVPTRETFCGSQVAVLAWCTTMGCKPFWWCIFRRHASSEAAFALLIQVTFNVTTTIFLPFQPKFNIWLPLNLRVLHFKFSSTHMVHDVHVFPGGLEGIWGQEVHEIHEVHSPRGPRDL